MKKKNKGLVMLSRHWFSTGRKGFAKFTHKLFACFVFYPFGALIYTVVGCDIPVKKAHYLNGLTRHVGQRMFHGIRGVMFSKFSRGGRSCSPN